MILFFLFNIMSAPYWLRSFKNTESKNNIQYDINYGNLSSCPCGGGQSCIIDRRYNNDWVHEDEVFINKKIPLRKHCFQKYNKSQYNALFNSG